MLKAHKREMDAPCGIGQQRQLIVTARVGRIAHKELRHDHVGHLDGMALLVGDLAVDRSRRQLLRLGSQRQQQHCYDDEIGSHEGITEKGGKYYLKRKKPLRKAQQL